jgi:hypothetical protein
MRKNSVRICVAVLAIMALVPLAFGADMLAGSWKIDMGKSKYSPADLAPKSGATTFSAVADGIKVVTDGVDSKGRKVHTDYTAKFDGKIVPTNGTIDGKPNTDADGSSWKKIDDYNYETTSALKGKVLTTTKVVIAKDGKSRTLTATGTNAQGQTVNNTVVYDKQ